MTEKLTCVWMCSNVAMVQVLARIRAAQDGAAGKSRSYTAALSEFRAGAKRGHYIWWIWPSLRGVRSTSRPDYELPSFACARAYLLDDVLRARLVEITEFATAHLAAGVSQKVLFGSMHSCDAPKFHEAMTLFAAAAACEGLSGPWTACTAGLSAVAPRGEQHVHTMNLIGLPLSPAGTLDTYTLRYESGWAAPRLHVRVAAKWRPLEAALAFSLETVGDAGGERWVAEFTAPPGAHVAVLPFCGAEWDHPLGGGEYELVPGLTALSGGSLTRPAMDGPNM